MSAVSSDRSSLQIYCDSPASAAENMRRDAHLFDRSEAEAVGPALRLYSWSAPAITVGYRQKPGDILDVFKCQDAGIEIVSRPTGGGLVFHKPDELTFALVVPLAFADQRFSRIYYNWMTGLFTELLRERGVKAGWGISSGCAPDRTDPDVIPFLRPSSTTACLCFSSAEAHEVVEAGQKILGVAQRRGRRSILQQGTLKRGVPGMTLADIGLWLNDRITDQDLLKRPGH